MYFVFISPSNPGKPGRPSSFLKSAENEGEYATSMPQPGQHVWESKALVQRKEKKSKKNNSWAKMFGKV